MISGVRILGLVFGAFVLIYSFAMRRSGKLRRGELFLAQFLFVSVWIIAIYPPIVDVLASIFQVEGRLFSIAILSSFVSFLLIIHLIIRLSTMRRAFGDLVQALALTSYGKDNVYESDLANIAVVIPAYNEEGVIAEVLDRIPEQVLGMNIRSIVVIDGASDRTGDVVQSQGGLAVFHVVNRGQGDALRTGFEIACREGAEIVVTMDADGQHRPEEIECLITPILEGQADYVMGSRFLGHYSDRNSTRHAGIVLYSSILSFFSRTKITDCTNGVRAIRASSLTRLELREPQFSAPELILEAVNKGLSIKEVPVSIMSRQLGSSKKPRGIVYPLKFGLAILKAWLRS